MTIQLLATELDTDPDGHGYAGIIAAGPDDETVNQNLADELNTENIERTRTAVPVAEIVEAIVHTEFAALTDAEREYVELLLTGVETLNVEAGNPKTALLDIFSGTTTRTNLIALSLEYVSRAQQLAEENNVLYKPVKPGHVAQARLLNA